MTPAGIKPATFRIVAQHLNHCATAVPHHSLAVTAIVCVCVCVCVCMLKTIISLITSLLLYVYRTDPSGLSTDKDL